ncbi:hypothetical protein E1A91_D05G369100v1 [Gossypium mustelinum]|uniref:Uncharacterized protein n=1 Tax=Gossypium mustelinum TaxID=34275 RepID=A0A5D2V558_GOSMU|nr:hypothetical protein E1A91_D05G369100v1 [Gossypium mustelinum]
MALSVSPSLSFTQNFPRFVTSHSLPLSQCHPISFQTPPPKSIHYHPPRALREWQEYEEAVKKKDLATALRFLISIEKDNSDDSVEENGSLSTQSARSQIGDLGFFGGSVRDWEVLDTCLNADDMRLVGMAYEFLKAKGFLPNFGRFSSIAYLMGCPIRGVILDPIVAMQMGIQGQAGTQFWDENMNNEMAEGQLSGSTFDRYCMVLFAGTAAEALVYGDAEGGENDENLFRSISVLLQPPLSVAQMSNQARWSVLQSYNLLKWHRHAHRAAFKAMENGASLSVIIRKIEEAMSSNR